MENTFSYSIKSGDQVSVSQGDKTLLTGKFIGRVIDPDNAKTSNYVVLTYPDMEFHFFKADETTLRFDKVKLEDKLIAPLVQTKDQLGGNCAAMSMHNCLSMLQQLSPNTSPKLDLLSDTTIDELTFKIYKTANADHSEIRDLIKSQKKLLQNLNVPHIVYDERNYYAKLHEIRNHIQNGELVILNYQGDWATHSIRTNMHDVIKGTVSAENNLTLFKPNTYTKDRIGHSVLIVGEIDIPEIGKKLIVVDSNTKNIILWDPELLSQGELEAIVVLKKN